MSQITTTSWSTTLASTTAKCPTEELFEYVSHAAKITIEPGESGSAVVKTGMAKAVVGSPLLLVRENFVGFANLFEAVVRVGIITDIRMILTRQAPLGLF